MNYMGYFLVTGASKAAIPSMNPSVTKSCKRRGVYWKEIHFLSVVWLPAYSLLVGVPFCLQTLILVDFGFLSVKTILGVAPVVFGLSTASSV